MKTIVEPKQNIASLWGKQPIMEDQSYRLMKYILRLDFEGKVLLHNVVTGQLVVLNQEEAKNIDNTPINYIESIEPLIAQHYLVPTDYDEHQQVVKLRKILWRFVDASSPKDVCSYLILPTTACNARCWYCFQKEVKPITMTAETANDVVNFIENHYNGKIVRLWWFGGEPTLAADKIDLICDKLRQKDIRFFSDITSNGYLFDEDMIDRAKKLWNLRQASFSLDGTEKNYNRIKAFPNVFDNPYERMMRNVGLMLENGIAVALRMNFDQNTYEDFKQLVREVKERFPKGAPVMVYPHQINVDYPKEERAVNEAWINEKNLELSNFACESGLYRLRETGLPSLYYEMCGAANGKWFVITPEGNLVCCGEHLGKDQVKGNVKEGVVNYKLDAEWKQFADVERCRDCALFPRCAVLLHCSAKDRCVNKKQALAHAIQEMKKSLRRSLE